MADEILALYCSQVLGQIKPANLFTISNEAYDVDYLIKIWNEDFNKIDIYFTLISKRKNTSSIFCFRKANLYKSINSNQTKKYLTSCGYQTNNLDTCIRCLQKKLLANSFPHEIGLFLGYPYEDVMGFIENNGKNYLCSGYFKVYKNKQAKLKLFEMYNKVRTEYKAIVDKNIELKNILVNKN